MWYGDESNSSGVVEDEPYVTALNHCAHDREGKRWTSREKNPKSFLKVSLHARGACAKFSSWTWLSLNDQSYTKKALWKQDFVTGTPTQL